MAINISTIENRLREEFSFSSAELQYIFDEVREAVSRHIHRNHHRPRDVFQMRIATPGDMLRNIPPDQHSYLMINFGQDPLDPEYMTYLQSCYGKVLFFHFHLNHSIIL